MSKFKCPNCGCDDDKKLVVNQHTRGDGEKDDITVACRECGNIWAYIPPEVKKTWPKYEYWRIPVTYEWLKALIINSNPCSSDKARLEDSEIIDIVPDEIHRTFNIILFMPRDNKVGFKPAPHGQGCELIVRDIQHDINAKYSTDYFNDKELEMLLAAFYDKTDHESIELYKKLELVKKKHETLKKYFQIEE